MRRNNSKEGGDEYYRKRGNKTLMNITGNEFDRDNNDESVKVDIKSIKIN